MVTELHSVLSGAGLESWHCDLFLCRSLYPHCASINPGVQIDTSGFIAEG